MKKILFPILAVAVTLVSCGKSSSDQALTLNDLEYFERPGVNVFVYNNLFTGGFNDEKNSFMYKILNFDEDTQDVIDNRIFRGLKLKSTQQDRMYKQMFLNLHGQ